MDGLPPLDLLLDTIFPKSNLKYTMIRVKISFIFLAESVIEDDLSLLVGLTVAVGVFLTVTILSINLIR